MTYTVNTTSGTFMQAMNQTHILQDWQQLNTVKTHWPSGGTGDAHDLCVQWKQHSAVTWPTNSGLSAEIIEIIWCTSAALPPRAECLCTVQSHATHSLTPGATHSRQTRGQLRRNTKSSLVNGHQPSKCKNTGFSGSLYNYNNKGAQLLK